MSDTDYLFGPIILCSFAAAGILGLVLYLQNPGLLAYTIPVGLFLIGCIQISQWVEKRAFRDSQKNSGDKQ